MVQSQSQSQVQAESGSGRVYVSAHVDMFDMVDIDLFTVVALNMMVVKLGYTSDSESLFYNYLRPPTSLDEGLYALDYEEDVRCMATLVRSIKLIAVYIEHGVTALDSYIRPPRFRATIEDITDEPGSIATNKTKKILLLTWHESNEPTKEPVCNSVTPSSLLQHDSCTPCKNSVCESITPSSMLSHDESFGVDDLDLNLNEPVNLNVSQIETQSELLVSKESDAGKTQEHIVAEEDESAPSDGQLFYDDEGIYSAYETEYDVQSSEDAGTDDDDDFLVEENEIMKPDVDVHLFGISMDVLFDNISFTNLVLDDVLEGEDVDIINADGFDSDPGEDDEISNYRMR
ncbi:hypothetical protein Tco_1119032, partial [Tanacetum coccineum]